MITCKLYARLANQCFMLAATIAHAKKMDTNWAAPKMTTAPRLWPMYFTGLPIARTATRYIYKEPRHAYDPIPEHDDLTIEGYFQSEKYFADAKPEVAKALGFPYKPLDTVAIHVRRGDFLQYPDQFPVLPFEYYEKSIQQMLALNFKTFRVYSDDPRWCMQAFGEMGEYYDITYSRNRHPIDDIREIYNSIAIITANSTFSLFPALLRPNDLIVVAPDESMWYGPKNTLETFDLMPERFIKIKA